jgi:hypothetical protein
MRNNPVEINEQEVERIVRTHYELLKQGLYADISSALSRMAYEILGKQFPDISGKSKYYSPSFPRRTFDSRALAIWNNNTSPYPHAALWLAYWTLTNTLQLAETIPKR